MTDVVEAAELSGDDNEKKAFAWEVIKNSNDVVLSFAKLMATVALTAVGVVLTLAKLVELEKYSTAWLVWLTIVCAGFFVASLMFSYAVHARHILVGPDDYDDVVEQVLEAAQHRHRATTVGLLVLGAATVGAIILIVAALESA
ncbi:hypothetical protein ACWCXH_25540 [Kitasatospora sp. NPDC001660]